VRVNDDSPAAAATPPRRRVRCPACAAETAYDASNAWRPFCSRRCRELDLGAWASERYRVGAADEGAEGDEAGTGAAVAPTGSRAA
jgi:endogenous inhibitor of DNA gyrase (YacG/DUF329 family)